MIAYVGTFFFGDQIKDGRLEAILVVKKPDVEHVFNHFLNKHLLMLFKLGAQIMNYGLHTLVIFLRDQIQYG